MKIKLNESQSAAFISFVQFIFDALYALLRLVLHRCPCSDVMMAAKDEIDTLSFVDCVSDILYLSITWFCSLFQKSK